MRLLVSVQSAAEAVVALEGGADLIDIKNPAAGSLGMAAAATMHAIREVVPAGRTLSAALGEVREREKSPVAALPSLNFCKLGLAGLCDWSISKDRWLKLRAAIDQQHGPQHWIAVAYADATAAQAPAPQVVLEAAIETGCVGLLIDTWDKSTGGLWSHLSEAVLRTLIDAAHADRLLVAVAGQLTADDLPRVQHLGADIAAVRSAACRNGQRDQTLCIDAVRELCACCQ
ncbi:MAG: hypothetical protein KDA58_13875 [Planctomycetaceae bacterium]|nr:hypothetical protein [Planctomycetaceae bacterium]